MTVYMIMLYNYPASIWSTSELAKQELAQNVADELLDPEDADEVGEIIEVLIDSNEDLF